MNLPNIITLLRIALIPVFMIFLPAEGPIGLTPIIIFAVASLTDGLDGYLARKHNLVTTFGKFMDPLADKLLVSAALVEFAVRGQMPAWAVMIIIAREFVVTSLRLVAVDAGFVMAAAMSGKIKTATQIVCILFMMTPLAEMTVLSMAAPIVWGTAVMWLMVAVTLWSGLDYLWRHRSLLQNTAG